MAKTSTMDTAQGRTTRISDEEAKALLGRFVAGEREAFDRLVDAYTPMLFAIFLRWFGLSREDAEDLYQEVLLQLVLKADEIRDVRRWLTGTAVRQAKKRIRRLIRDRNLAEKYLEQCETAAADGPDDDDARDLVTRGLHRLAPADRRLLELLYLEELSYREAADRLGWPIGSVGPRRGRALNRLRATLRELETPQVV